MVVGNQSEFSRLAPVFSVFSSLSTTRTNPIALCLIALESGTIHRFEGNGSRINTYVKIGCNLSEMSTYEFIEFKATQNEHLQKNRGEGYPVARDGK
jgi:hypothetical protein